MTYTSLGFAVFCLALLIIYYLIPKRFQWVVLLVWSIAFYAFSGIKYLAYVLVTACTTYVTALLIGKNKKVFADSLPSLSSSLSPEELKARIKKNDIKSRNLMIIAVLVDLGILVVLKYLDFLIGNINAFLPQDKAIRTFSFILPLGLSFYTFSAVGYVVDVARGKYTPEKNIAKFLLYLIYFPHIIQGPIPRFDRLGPQLSVGHDFDFKAVRSGYQLILWGLFKKMVIADNVAPVVASLLKNTDALSGLEMWIGMIVWGIQLYTDFSGGIDVARGVSEMLGIELEENFKRPYFATSLTDYWNRWHISLGNWLKDYFFYSVALSSSFSKINKFTRKKFGKFIAKTVPVGILSLILFTIIGIWHGANWGEVLFGVFNGTVILISTLCEPLYAKLRKVMHLNGSFAFRIFQSVRTFFLITLARVISLPSTIRISGYMIAVMFGSGSSGVPFFSLSENLCLKSGLIMLLPAVVGCVLLFVVSLIEERGKSIRELINSKPLIIRILIASAGTAAIVLFGAYGIGYVASDFIYSNY